MSFICGGIQGYQAYVGDLRGAGGLEWPIRILLVVGGFVLATPGGGIVPISQTQIMMLGCGDPGADGGPGADAAAAQRRTRGGDVERVARMHRRP